MTLVCLSVILLSGCKDQVENRSEVGTDIVPVMQGIALAKTIVDFEATNGYYPTLSEFSQNGDSSFLTRLESFYLSDRGSKINWVYLANLKSKYTGSVIICSSPFSIYGHVHNEKSEGKRLVITDDLKVHYISENELLEALGQASGTFKGQDID